MFVYSGVYEGAFSIMLGILTLIFGAAALLFYAVDWGTQQYFDEAKEYIVNATIVAKESIVKGDIFGRVDITPKYTVTVELDEGRRIVFDNMESEQYHLLFEGDSGVLRYRCNEPFLFFIDFQRNPNRESVSDNPLNQQW